jgi:hypothetical protein
MNSEPLPSAMAPQTMPTLFTSAISVRKPPSIMDAKWPIIIFLAITLVVAVILAAWSFDDEKRRHAVEFWTGGLGILGVMAVGCGCIVMFYGARVFDDTLRVVQADTASISASVAKTSDKVGNGVGFFSRLFGR